MRRILPLLVLILVSSAASAFVGMQSDAPALDSTVSPNTLITFVFKPIVNDVDERDVTIDLTAAPATIETIQSEQFTCTKSGTTAHCARALFPKNTVGMPIKIGARNPAFGVRLTAASKITDAS